MKPLSFFLVLMLALSLSTPASAFMKSDVTEGKRLYKSFCLVCHGASGDSFGSLAVKLGLTPPYLSGEGYRVKSVDQLIFLIGGYGGPDNVAMPFFWKDELSKSEIISIAKYIRTIKKGNINQQGNLRKGKGIYRSSCVACHGAKGKGGGTLAKIIGAPKIGFTNGLSIRYLVDEELLSVIRDGKGDYMPGWGETLEHDEIVDVAAYIRSLTRHR